MKKNNILEYLKNFDITSNNVHKEKEFNNYIISVVMISNDVIKDKLKTTDYEVYLVIQDKKDNSIYNNVNIKKFNNNVDASSYYDELYEQISTMKESNIISLLKKS